MSQQHPQVDWGCDMMSYSGKATDNATMLYSPNAYQYMTFRIDDCLFVRVFGLRSKLEENESEKRVSSEVDPEKLNQNI